METQRKSHSISLKVLRLSRPNFAEGICLPEQPADTELPARTDAALAYQHHESQNFFFHPVLNLPPAFGSAYVGETFSCTLCANNELPESSNGEVSSVNISAEMQAPTQTVPLELVPADEEDERPLEPAESLQKIVRFDLKEEGNHVLAVNVNYTERRPDDKEGRIRSFRKLYQFVAAPCLSVRTKVSDASIRQVSNERHSFALEAQLENMADGPIMLETVAFSPKPSMHSNSINWDASMAAAGSMERPFLMPRDVTQVVFLLKQKSDSKVDMTKDGRVILGQLMIEWRTSLGDAGFLTTGWLTSRKPT